MNCILILIILNVLVFILAPKAVWWQLALSSHGIRQFKFWQFVSYMFLHGGVMHILFNMWGLYLFGQHVLARLGTQRFLTLYFLSGISGAGLWLLFNWNSPAPVIGASGAVFGVIMAAALFFPNMQIMLLFPPIPMKLRTFVLLFAGIEILSELSTMQGNVAHLAHLGGFLAAYIYIRKIGGEGLLDIVKTPFHGFTGSSHQDSQDTIVPPKQSKLNRKTFESIMTEIEEIEREEKRKQENNPENP